MNKEKSFQLCFSRQVIMFMFPAHRQGCNILKPERPEGAELQHVFPAGPLVSA